MRTCFPKKLKLTPSFPAAALRTIGVSSQHKVLNALNIIMPQFEDDRHYKSQFPTKGILFLHFFRYICICVLRFTILLLALQL